MSSESVILCEGYHDRAFWAAWLTRLGCTDPGKPEPGSNRRKPIEDPWKNEVKGGQYAYHSLSGKFVRVMPCGGKDSILPVARNRLTQRGSKRLARLVINVDSDVDAGAAASQASRPSLQAVEQLVRRLDPKATRMAEGDWRLDDGATVVSVVRWETEDARAAGLPNEQTLERLVCAAVIAAYPKRAPAVQKWLDARPNGPASGPKEFAWSYMAGWYAESSCEFFYRRVWDDLRIVKELESRLRSSGTWQVAEDLAH